MKTMAYDKFKAAMLDRIRCLDDQAMQVKEEFPALYCVDYLRLLDLKSRAYQEIFELYKEMKK